MAEIQRTSVSLPAPMLADVKAEAAALNMSVSEYVRALIRSRQLSDPGHLDLRREGKDGD